MNYIIIGEYSYITHNTIERKDVKFTTKVIKDTVEEAMEEIINMAKAIATSKPYNDDNMQMLINFVKEAKSRFKLSYIYEVGTNVSIIKPDTYKGVTFTNAPEIHLYIAELE